MLFKIHASLVRPIKRFPRLSHCESQITSAFLSQLNMSRMKRLREWANGGGIRVSAIGVGLLFCLVSRERPLPVSLFAVCGSEQAC